MQIKTVAYEEKFGEYTIPSELKSILKGKPIDEQLSYFRITWMIHNTRTNWTDRRESRGYKPVFSEPEVKAVILDDGIIVGAMIEDECGGDVACFLDQCVCTYSASDNNGAGYIEREDYLGFVAVSDDFTKKD